MTIPGNFRTKIMRLSEVHASEWVRKIVKINLVTDKEQTLHYEGEILEPRHSAEAHSIEFEFFSSPLRTVKVNIPLWTTCEATVSLSINDRLVDVVDIGSSGDGAPQITAVCYDVTEYTESTRTSHVAVRVSYRGAQGKTAILVGGRRGELAASIEQPWKWSYGLQAVCFFAAMAIIIQAVLLFLAMESGDWKAYGALSSVGIWLLGLFGIADWVKLPARRWIRVIYGKMRRSRYLLIPALVGLVGFAILLIGAEGAVICCIHLKNSYNALIKEYMDGGSSEPLLKALRLVPVRTEAQLLLSRHTFLRETQHKGELWSNPEIKLAVTRALPWYQRTFCLAGRPQTGDYLGNEGLHDPTVWYASVLPEADGQEELKYTGHAIGLLTGNNQPEAILLRLSLQIESAAQQRDRMEVERIAKELSKALEAAAGSDVSMQHVYQEGWDRLAQYKLSTGERSDASTAVQWFIKEVIEKREHTINRGVPGVWLRPPDKLAVFHYARVLLYNEEGGMIEIFREHLDKRPEFKAMIHEEFMNIPYLKEKKWWYENTLLGPGWGKEEIWDHIKKLQEHGWRY